MLLSSPEKRNGCQPAPGPGPATPKDPSCSLPPHISS
ncbi:zinc finger protein 454, isoform CRA_a [Mus musculus]|nr:zinc finger protein 454, isoform CRA_a [Mus musculus]